MNAPPPSREPAADGDGPVTPAGDDRDRPNRFIATIDGFIPHELVQLGHDARRRARLLVGGALMLSAMSIGFALNAVTLQRPVWYTFYVLGVGALLLACTPVVLRRSGSAALAGTLAVFAVLFEVAMLVWRIGPEAPARLILIVMPMVAFFFVGARVGLVTMVVAIVVIIGLHLKGDPRLAETSGYTQAELRQVEVALMCVLAVFVAGLSWVYEAARIAAEEVQERARASLRKSNEALVRARDEAQQASEAKTAFLATVSHEIRNPLHGVIGTLSLLERTQLDDRQRQYVAMGDRSARLLEALVGDVLDLSKIEAGRVELELAPVEVRGLVEAVIGNHLGAARGKGLLLSAEVAPEVPAVVRMDPLRVEQILNNLLGNAIKFTGEGSVRLQVARLGTGGGDVLLRFEVRDTGIGIEPELIGQVFEPFRQADSSTTRRYGGTGLGLPISQRLARLMGGEVHAQSEPGQGSVFRLDLPVERVEPEAPQAAEGEAGRRTPSGIYRAVAMHDVEDDAAGVPQRKRVLVVEDDPVSQSVTTHMLDSLHVQVTVASSGGDAVRALQADEFDLILMDCAMPGMDGFEATVHIRRREAGGRRVPIVALTAHGFAAQRRRCREAGMDDVLVKPVTRERLAEMLDRYLEVDGPGGEPA